jgi:hypothetical protein
MQNGIEGFLGKMKQTRLNHHNFFLNCFLGVLSVRGPTRFGSGISEKEMGDCEGNSR